jgi:predicted transcriptional regulator
MRTMTVAGPLCWLVALAGSIQAQVVARPALTMPAVVMEDQFEKPHQLDQLKGKVVVLIYGDRKSADVNKALGEAIHVSFHPAARGLPPEQAQQAPSRPVEGLPQGASCPDVVTVPVASIGKVPGLVRSLIRSQIRGGSPKMAVWLDFQDQLKQQFGLGAGVSNVLVVDAVGRLRYTVTGPISNEQLAQLTAAIEGLRRECATNAPPG